jgi:hypothetical protein
MFVKIRLYVGMVYSTLNKKNGKYFHRVTCTISNKAIIEPKLLYLIFILNMPLFNIILILL